MAFPLIVAAALVASVSRCNNEVASQLQDQLRAYSTKPVTAANDLDQRLSDLAYIVQEADQEYDIVSNVCPNPADLAVVATQLYADDAWAMEQQADVGRRRAMAQCPGSAEAVGAGFLAAGWRKLILATPTDPNKTASPYVVKLTTLYQQQAPVYKLDLPAQADTSDYWVKSIQDKGNAAAQACPSPQR